MTDEKLIAEARGKIASLAEAGRNMRVLANDGPEAAAAERHKRANEFWDHAGRYARLADALEAAGEREATLRGLSEDEAWIITLALEWAQYRYAADHLGQPTEHMARDTLDKLLEACADLQANNDGEWRSPS